MTIFRHELRRGASAFAIWTAAVAFLMAVCVFLFPEMKGEMDAVSDMFASMGSFTAAFGMDKLDFGTLIGYYGIECGNVLGLGGAFFAALAGVSALAKEEKEHTAEFLLTHPVRRSRVITEKLLAVLSQVIAINLVVWAVAVASIALVGETIPWAHVMRIHIAYLIMQLEIACVCFGASAFIKRGGLGAGLGLAAIMYFANLIANIAPSAEWLKYITPYAYAESANIVSDEAIDIVKLSLGCVYGAICAGAAYARYARKDIAG